MKKILVTSLALMSILIGCDSESVNNNEDVPTAVDVYIAGTEGNQFKYWKNGVSYPLASITTEHSAYVEDFSIDGTNAYALIRDTLHNAPIDNPLQVYHKYYKNGSEISLNLPGQADFMDVLNGSVYTAYSIMNYGADVGQGFYTNNGSPTYFTTAPSSIPPTSFRGLKVKGTDVYIAAHYNDWLPCYYKNGNLTILGEHPTQLNVPNRPSGSAADIYIDDANNVYMCGYYSPNGSGTNPTVPYKLFYSKNQTIHYIDETDLLYGACGIAVTGDDVYLIASNKLYWNWWWGSENAVSKLWKNGTEISLSHPSGTIGYDYNDIEVLNGNVYVVGTLTFAGGITKSALWVNGVLSVGAEGTTGQQIVVKQN